MNLDQQTIDWMEEAISRIQYGEVSITLVIHQGRIVSRNKRIEEKEHEDLIKS